MEELKVIMETVAALGAEAKWAFFAWLAYKAFAVTGVAATILSIVLIVVKAIQRGMQSEAILRQMTSDFDLRWYEREELVKKISDLRVKATV